MGDSIRNSLRGEGHDIVRMIRRHRSARARVVRYSLPENYIDKSKLEGTHAVIHLAGEPIANEKWTRQKMRAIRDSRVLSTRLISETCAEVKLRPRVLLCASAIGYYGDRGDEFLDESSAAGEGFLSEVCQEWEAATQPAVDAGIRVVNMRFGVILSAGGGALQKMIPPIKSGLGGRFGSGRQYMSWITLADVIRGVSFLLQHPTIHGPVNMVSQDPVTNGDFTKVLAGALGRPALLPVPPFVLRMMLGDLADETLLASQQVVPKALIDAGFQFRHKDIVRAIDLLVNHNL